MKGVGSGKERRRETDVADPQWVRRSREGRLRRRWKIKSLGAFEGRRHWGGAVRVLGVTTRWAGTGEVDVQ